MIYEIIQKYANVNVCIQQLGHEDIEAVYVRDLTVILFSCWEMMFVTAAFNIFPNLQVFAMILDNENMLRMICEKEPYNYIIM